MADKLSAMLEVLRTEELEDLQKRRSPKSATSKRADDLSSGASDSDVNPLTAGFLCPDGVELTEVPAVQRVSR